MVRRLIQRSVFGCAMAVAVLSAASCGEVVRSSRAPVVLIIDSIEAASGAEPDEFGSILMSDVETVVTQTVNGQEVRIPTAFNDLGRATFRIALKNPGTPAAPLSPTTLNDVTINRYRVVFRRADGRNTPGVDVPYGFDGAFTVTVPSGGNATGGFDIVRHQNKREPPLSNMVGGGAARLMSTIAEITFYGRDQAGNDISATGFLTVNFGDFGDPQ